MAGRNTIKGKRKATSPPPKASKRTKRQTSPPPTVVKAKPPNDVKLAVMRSDAKKSNMYGVRIVNKNLENGTSVLAGYLFLKDTNALRKLLEDSDIANGILKAWAQSRKLGFGVVEKDEKTTWLKQSIWGYLMDPKSLTKEQLDYTIPLPKEDRTLDGMARGYVSWIVTMFKVMKAVPACFEGTDTPGALCGRSFEDWNRAYELMRAYWRVHSDSRKATVPEESQKRQNKPAEPPLFLKDSDYGGVTTQEEGMLTAVNIGVYLDEYDEASDDEEETKGSQVPADELLKNSVKFDEELMKSFRHITTSLEAIDAANYRPKLDSNAQVRLLAYLGQQAKVIYPPEEEINLDQAAPVTPQIIDQTRASGAEEVLGDAEKVATQTREEFWSLMTTLNGVSATAPTYEAACTILHLDPKNPEVVTGKDKSVKPYPWQIVAVAWIHQMEESALRGCLIADDMGLGKTLTALLLVEMSPSLGSLHGLGTPIYKPTLIACPSSAFGTWKEQITKFFPSMTRKYYMGSPSKGAFMERTRILATKPADLKRWVSSLDPHDPGTARTVVLTTYTTWLKRTIREEDVPTTSTPHHDRDEDDDDDDEGYKEVDEEILNKLQTHCADLFDRVICDEAHKLKSDRTKTSRAIKLLNANRLVFMSATPMINKPLDLTGVLSLLWKDEFARDSKDLSSNNSQKIKQNLALADFESAKRDVEAGKLTAVNLDQYLYLLDPSSFRHYAQPPGGSQMEAGHANVILPPLLTIIQLRRTMSDTVLVGGKPVRVAADVPPYRITTVELAMSKQQSRKYNAVHKTLAGLMRGGGDAETGEGHLDQGIHRLMCHASFNPQLHKFSSKLSAVKNVNKWSEGTSDFGCNWYHRQTRGDNFSPPYCDRVSMAVYMGATSVKLQWLAGMLHDICNKKGAKVILFHDWPLTLWNTTAFVMNLGFPVVDIRSAHSLAERDAAAKQFNDPNSSVKILITSIRTMSASVNLQDACHHMIFLEVPGSANTTMQAIGRIFRLGQTEAQKIWIVTVDGTYDQVIQARAANKMIGQIAGQGNLGVDTAAIEAQKAQHPEWDDETAKNAVIHAKAVGLYTQMFGQQDSRHEWTDVKDLKAKDRMRAERTSIGTTPNVETRGRKRNAAETADTYASSLKPHKNLNSSTPYVEPVKNLSTEEHDLPWSSYLRSDKPADNPDNPTLEDEDGELTFPDYFGTLDADDTSSLEELKKEYNLRRAEMDSNPIVEGEKPDPMALTQPELDEALFVVTTPHLRKAYLETYDIKLRALWKKNKTDPMLIDVPLQKVPDSSKVVATASSLIPVDGQEDHHNSTPATQTVLDPSVSANPQTHIPPIHEKPTQILTTTTEAAKPQDNPSGSKSSPNRPKRGAAVKSDERTHKQLGEKENWKDSILMDSPDPEVNLYYPNLRLADFGMSYTIPNEMIRDFKRKYGVGGTPGFTAPEMRPELHGDPQVTYPFPGSHSDVHSLGDTMMEFIRCAKSRYPSHAVPLLLEGLEEGWGWDYWPYSEELTRLVDQCRAPDGRDRPSAYALYLTTKKKSESMLEGQTALEQRAQADISARGLTKTSVLFTQEMQAKYRTSDLFRDRYHRRTDWFNRHRVDINNLCDVARNPRPPPPGYVAIGNGLRFARIPEYPNPQGHRRRGEPGPRESYISLNDQQGQTLPANVRAAGEVLQGGRQTKGFGGKVRNFFSRMRRTGR